MRRLLGATATLGILLGLTACGGGDDGGDAPADAAKQDFCAQSAKLLTTRSAADVRAWAAEMAKVGTPEGITRSQRAGFERTIELAGKSKGDADGGLGAVDPDSEDGRNVLAFIGYAENTCPDSFQDALPTPLPTPSAS